MNAAMPVSAPPEHAHVVEFYDTDAYLVDVVAGFIAEGLAVGDAVVVIATDDHRRQFAGGLHARGCDPDAAIASGRLLMLDAAETLGHFMDGPLPDPVRFRQVLDSALTRVTGGDRSRPIRAYGEMVDVLWRNGNPSGAIRLEDLWNDAQRDRSFSLLCAYVMASFYKEPSSFRRVCEAHSHVRRPERAADTSGDTLRALAAEIAHRTEVEQTLRACVHELHAKEEALRKRERELRDFVDNGTIGMHWVAADGTILWANRAETDLLGYAPNEYVGRSITEFHADPDVVADILARLLRGEVLRDRAARMIAKDGSIRHVLIDSSAYREGDTFVHTRCFTRDVTDRRAAEESLRTSEARLRAIADTLPVLVALSDVDQRYQFVNARYESWFAAEPGTIVGRHLSEVVGAAAFAVARPHVVRVMAGATERFDFELPHHAGPRLVEATYAPDRDKHGRITGCVSVLVDVHERRSLEAARERDHRRTQQLLQVTASIAAAITAEEVFTAVVDEVGAAIGATAAGLFLLDEAARSLQMVRSAGYQEDQRAKLAVTPLEPGRLPVVDCILDGRPIWLGSQDELVAVYPHLRSVVSTGRTYRVACLPIVADGRAIGALGLTFDFPSSDDDADRDFLQLVTRYSAQALERIRLLEVERRSRAEAEASAERMKLLSEASRAFTAAGTDVESVLDVVATSLVAAEADLCTILLVPDDGDVLRVGAARHRDAAESAVVRELLASRPQRIGEGLLGTVARTGEPVFLSEIDREQILAVAHVPYRAWIAAHLPHSMIVVPLRARGAILGVICLTRHSDTTPFAVADFELALSFAERAALAIDNAHLHRADRAARLRAELLSGLARDVLVAERAEDIFEAALAAIGRGLGTERSAILTYGGDSVMRFRAWRGLSETYRTAVDGHSPWTRDTRDPQPVVIADAIADPALVDYRPLFAIERVGALAFIPLVSGQALLGKLMVYYDAPRALGGSELELARAIANHVAAAIARFAALDELRETVRFNEMFTGILGHDLRNPLGAIMNAAQLAIARSPGERITKPLARVLTSGTRMARMIEQLLDFTRVRIGGGIPVTPQPLDVVAVIRQAMEEFEDAHPDRVLRLEIAGRTMGAWDADRLAQVFSNLIGNAVQHGEPAVGVDVVVDGSDDERVRVVIRNGGAIPTDLLGTMFDPMSGTRRRRDGSRGLGLGLYISQEIVKAHRGTITVASSADSTSFAIELPR